MSGEASSAMPAGAGMILSSGLMKLASFEAVQQFVDRAMLGDPATSVMSGGKSSSSSSLSVLSPRFEAAPMRVWLHAVCPSMP